MANRVASIVFRTCGPKRNWVAANRKTDPPGTYYIRWCEDSTNRFAKAGANYAEAEIAQLRKERVLNAALIGAVIPEEAPPAKAHRVADVITEYLADLSDTAVLSDPSSLRRLRFKHSRSSAGKLTSRKSNGPI